MKSTTRGFKQEDRVHYQARDMAVVRGNLGQCAVVLASATPSIESHVNARTGRYAHAVLPGRFSGVEMPDISAIDLRSRSAGERPVAERRSWSRPSTRRWPRGSRRCCSSTGAGMRR